jgi:hypothetical protein
VDFKGLQVQGAGYSTVSRLLRPTKLTRRLVRLITLATFRIGRGDNIVTVCSTRKSTDQLVEVGTISRTHVT